MLQQTTVAAVIPRFERFLKKWPTLEALAAAGNSELLSEWAGLGYYARARNLIACARQLAARGGFPSTSTELRKLPGIGAYTSAAIAAIAFGEAAPAVDTNVERVIARLHAYPQPARSDVERHVAKLMRRHSPGDVVQALMDLGATVCRPRQPSCHACPLEFHCAAAASGVPEAFPQRRERKVRGHRYGIAWWTERSGQVSARSASAVGAARRDGGASRQRLDKFPPDRKAWPGSGAPRLYPFLARSCDRAARRARWRRLVAPARPTFPSRAADALPPRCRACAATPAGSRLMN